MSSPKDLLLFTLIIPFLAAALSPLVYRKLGRKIAVVVPFLGALLPFLGVLSLLRQTIQNKSPLMISFLWADAISLRWDFVIDGFGGIFALLVSGIGFLIVWYAHFYMEKDPGVGRFFGFLLFFLGSMLGVCLAEHMFVMFLFWELTSISSFLLIGFWFHKEKSRYGALKALVITSVGGLLMMAGFGLLGAKTNAWGWTQISAMAPSFINTTWMTVAFILILFGAFTKSAQFPYHFWLPDAMEAPTPVSAFLHSATMVKAGIILLYRIFPIFHEHFLWLPVLSIFGMITVVVGAVLALKHTDLKAILAYSTISQLGLFVVMQGYASTLEILRAGLIFHIVVHALYKGSLFMLVGIIDHGTHTRDIRKLGNLKKWMPRTCFVIILSACSLAGLPPFLGFISKEGALEATWHIAHSVGSWTWALPIALTFSASLTVAVAGKISLGVFFSKPSDPSYLAEHKPHEASWGFLLPPALLAVGGLIFGLAPVLLEKLLYPAAMMGIQTIPVPHFALWHGLTPALGLSATAVAIGSIIFVYRHPIQKIHEKLKLSFNLNTLYDRKWETILNIASRVTSTIQNGSLSQYVAVTVGFLFFVLTFGLVSRPDWQAMQIPLNFTFGHELFVGIGIVLASLLVVRLKDRIGRLVNLGAVGLLICVYFIFRGAPDLALTGFLIEIVMFVLILIVFKQLKEEDENEEPFISKTSKALLSSFAGLAIGILCFLTLNLPSGESISPYFLENSDKLAGGLNVVNVILVDFRGFDTMGEIAVLCLAGLGVFALRKIWSTQREDAPHPRELSMKSLPPSTIFQTVSGWVFPFIIFVSLYLVFQGHNHPGGGFIGGLITAGALVLELLAIGRNRFLKICPVNGTYLFSFGLALAFLTGLVPLFFGYPFLTSYVFESIHFSTAGFFDLGVYLVVVGVTMEIIVLIEESERKTVV